MRHLTRYNGRPAFKWAAHILRRIKARIIRRIMRHKDQPKPLRPDESKIAFQALSLRSSHGLMIDVGAHHGGALAAFARAGWTVQAFEPDAENRRKLIDRFGGLANVRVDPRALSDESQDDATLYRSDESTGISGLSSFHASHFPADKVRVTTLKHAMSELGLLDQRVSFLKIDTEGFDLPVLRGFPWNHGRPELILCEFENSKTEPLGYTFYDLAGFLADKGYRVIVSEWHPIQKYGITHDWHCFYRYPGTLRNPRAWGNILATDQDDLHQALMQICDLEC